MEIEGWGLGFSIRFAVSPTPRNKEAERRQTLFNNLRTLRRGSALSGQFAFRVPPHGVLPRDLIIPKAQLQARLPGTWSERALPAFACPSPATTSRPGRNAGRLMPKPPGSGS